MILGQISSPIFLRIQEGTAVRQLIAAHFLGNAQRLHPSQAVAHDETTTADRPIVYARGRLLYPDNIPRRSTEDSGTSQGLHHEQTAALSLADGWLLCLSLATSAFAQETRDTATYRRLKTALDAIPAIDTHDHLWPFDRLPGLVDTERGKGMNLAGLWRNSYFAGVHPLTPWKPGMPFIDWWAKAKLDFRDARATSVYRYQLPAFTDLYNVDFDHITDVQARALNDQIFAHYQDQSWLFHVITERANIELMLNDPYWGRFELQDRLPLRRAGLQRHHARLRLSSV